MSIPPYVVERITAQRMRELRREADGQRAARRHPARGGSAAPGSLRPVVARLLVRVASRIDARAAWATARPVIRPGAVLHGGARPGGSPHVPPPPMRPGR
jgi:hypothetical protein